jgi:hypothetical protein
MSIAFDNASTMQAVSSTSLTYSFTVGPISNGLLLVGVSLGSLATTPTVTYNGVAMTLVNSASYNFGTGKSFLFALIAPPSGAHNVVITPASTQTIRSSCASYSGVNQSVTPDASTTSSGTGTTTTLTLTTIANSCWTFAWSVGTASSAGAGATLRSNSGQSAASFDSNGPITPAGSTSMTLNFTSSSYSAVMASFAPAAAAPVAAPGFFRMF